MAVDRLRISDDHRVIRLSIGGNAEFDPENPCSSEYLAVTDVVDGVLRVGVYDSGRRPEATLPPNAGCADIGYIRQIRVVLDEPYDGVEWDDLAGFRGFLAAPPGVLEPTLPPGWTLVKERDVADIAAGMWMRVYATDSGADDRDTLALYQSFGAPIPGSGYLKGITHPLVNAVPAELGRGGMIGGLELHWCVGHDGLEFDAYEPRFSSEDLIALAETIGGTVPCPVPPPGVG